MYGFVLNRLLHAKASTDVASNEDGNAHLVRSSAEQTMVLDVLCKS